MAAIGEVLKGMVLMNFSERHPRRRRKGWTGLRLLVLSALALSIALSTLLLTLDLIASADLLKAKGEGKAAVKRGKTAARGVTYDAAQGQAFLAVIFGSALLVGTAVGLRPLVRTRRLPSRTKWRLGSIGLFVGIPLIWPTLAVIRILVRLLVSGT